MLALGAAVGWILARRGGSADVQGVRQLAAARASLDAERSRRESLEAEAREARDAEGRAREELAALSERAESADRLAREQREFLETSRRELEDSFRSLATLALRGNTEEFLRLAEERWKTTRAEAAGDLEQRRRGIETLLAPLKETLGKLETRTGEIERAREGAYRGLEERLEGLRRAAVALEERTTSLASALRGTKAQGRWGEMALRNVVELAGMTEHVDFTEQEGIADGGRPDMVVRLPNERFLAVDAKVSLNAYLEAADAKTDEDRARALDAHVAALRNHVKTLAMRNYAAVSGDLDLTVLFLPGDPFLAAAFERSPDLQTEALREKVVIATPTTLVALLRTVAIYWQQRALAENAERIAGVARELYDKASTFGAHLANVGSGLADALDAYNRAVGSFERRLLPMARKLEELGTVPPGARPMAPPAIIEDTPRRVEALPDDELAALPLFDLPSRDDRRPS
jgi:DNA recombination protein RmuC